MAKKHPSKKKRTRAGPVILGARVRYLRERLALDQTQLGAAMGVAASRISEIENNRNDVTTATFLNLVRKLRVRSGDYLLGLTDELPSRS